MNWHSVFFLLSALMTCGFAVAVVVSGNIVRMAFYLVISLCGVAALYFLAGADFVGAMQLMIYVGGTLVLLIFGVMLTARGPFVNMQIAGGNWLMAGSTGLALMLMLSVAAFSVDDWSGRKFDQQSQIRESDATATRLGMGLLGIRVDKLQQKDPVLRAGMSGYLLPFEIVSVHLLVVLIGAAYLARARRRVAAKPEAGDKK